MDNREAGWRASRMVIDYASLTECDSWTTRNVIPCSPTVNHLSADRLSTMTACGLTAANSSTVAGYEWTLGVTHIHTRLSTSTAIDSNHIVIDQEAEPRRIRVSEKLKAIFPEVFLGNLTTPHDLAIDPLHLVVGQMPTDGNTFGQITIGCDKSHSSLRQTVAPAFRQVVSTFGKNRVAQRGNKNGKLVSQHFASVLTPSAKLLVGTKLQFL